MRWWISAAVLLAACDSGTAAPEREPPAPRVYDVYVLAGQSNMVGYGFDAQLPAVLSGAQDEVPIYHGNDAADGATLDGRGRWSTLSPGHGVGFTSNGAQNRLSDRFGVELTFAREMAARHPDRHVALLKYARGATSIDTAARQDGGAWDPDVAGINQFDHFAASARLALARQDVNGDGVEDTLVPAGIVWMQGEGDTGSSAVAGRYQANLARLMTRIRATLGDPNLPVVVGRISDSGAAAGAPVWPYGETVRQAQAAFVAADGHAALVTSTDQYSTIDRVHYDSPGYLDLGTRFAQAMAELQR